MFLVDSWLVSPSILGIILMENLAAILLVVFGLLVVAVVLIFSLRRLLNLNWSEETTR